MNTPYITYVTIIQMKPKLKLSTLLFPITMFLLSFWAWRIFENNLLVFFISLILTVLFFLIIEKQSNFFLNATFLLLLIAIILITIPGRLNQYIWEKSDLDIITITAQRSYYPAFGSAFHNKYFLAANKYQQGLMSAIDINYYFFASHPRERATIEDFEKFLPIFIPLLILGIIKLFKNIFSLVITIFVLALSPILDPRYYLGPVFIFPIFTAILAVGAKVLFDYADKKKGKYL